jgi:hypothetical protein
VFWRTAAGVAHWNACWPAKRWFVAWLRSPVTPVLRRLFFKWLDQWLDVPDSCHGNLVFSSFTSTTNTPWLIDWGVPQKRIKSDLVSYYNVRHQWSRAQGALACFRLCRLRGPVWKCQTDECPWLRANCVSRLG